MRDVTSLWAWIAVAYRKSRIGIALKSRNGATYLQVWALCRTWRGIVATYLEVEVGDPLGVHVLQAAEDLLDEEGGLGLAETLLLCDEFEQLASADPGEQDRDVTVKNEA